MICFVARTRDKAAGLAIESRFWPSMHDFRACSVDRAPLVIRLISCSDGDHTIAPVCWVIRTSVHRAPNGFIKSFVSHSSG